MSTNPSSSEVSPSSTPLSGNNAPKFGTPVPNRIFVGGISATTTDTELYALFSAYGNVKQTKIISDRAGVSKGYGFVTFETEEEAKRIQNESNNIVLKDRKLNIAPAVKKQPFPRTPNIWSEPPNDRTVSTMGVYTTTATIPNADSTQTIPNGTVLYHNGIPYTYHNGMAIFSPVEGSYPYMHHHTATSPYSFVYPQAVYLPQHYQYSASTAQSQWSNSNQWRLATPFGYGQNLAGGAPSGQYLISTAASPTALHGNQPTTDMYPCTTMISPPVYPQQSPDPGPEPPVPNTAEASANPPVSRGLSATSSYRNSKPRICKLPPRGYPPRAPPTQKYGGGDNFAKPSGAARFDRSDMNNGGGPLTPPPTPAEPLHESVDMMTRKMHNLGL